MPAGKNAARRLEQRVAGADTNPYLVFAVLLASIIDGIDKQLNPGAPIAGDGYEQAGTTLPTYLSDAVELFEHSDFIHRNLGSELQRIYSLSKWQENAEFRGRITELEYQSYLEKL